MIYRIFKELTRIAYLEQNPFVAAIVEKSSGQILSLGLDHHWISPLLHSETEAIHKLWTSGIQAQPSNYIMVTTAEPCSMCQAAIMWSGIDRVSYGVSRAFLVRSGLDFFKMSASDVNGGSEIFTCQLQQDYEAESEKLFSDLLPFHMKRGEKDK